MIMTDPTVYPSVMPASASSEINLAPYQNPRVQLIKIKKKKTAKASLFLIPC